MPWATHIQHILLHHRMQYDGDEQIEEDSGTVLPAIVVEGDFPFCKDNKNTFTSDRKVKLTSTKPALLSRDTDLQHGARQSDLHCLTVSQADRHLRERENEKKKKKLDLFFQVYKFRYT